MVIAINGVRIYDGGKKFRAGAVGSILPVDNRPPYKKFLMLGLSMKTNTLLMNVKGTQGG